MGLSEAWTTISTGPAGLTFSVTEVLLGIEPSRNASVRITPEGEAIESGDSALAYEYEWLLELTVEAFANFNSELEEIKDRTSI